MARPPKKGLDYFPFDAEFFSDRKIRILKSKYGADGIAVYIHVICDIYREGYYIEVDNLNDYLYLIADDTGASYDKVQQIIAYLCKGEILQKFEATVCSGVTVITSHGIQKRYVSAMKGRKKRVADVKGEYWLLSESEEAELDTFIKSAKNEDYSENNHSFSEKNPDKSEINDANKKKINKREISKEKLGENDEGRETSPLPAEGNSLNENVGKKRKEFIPPTLEQVTAYAEERGRVDLAKKFFDYFEAGNWYDSEGKPVKVWKQKFITWETQRPYSETVPKSESRRPIKNIL